MSATYSPLISILVPVYNAQPYLGDCVNSILRQSDDAIELVLLDDASTDDSWNIMQMLASEDRRVRVLRQSHNSGVSAARNRLLAEGRGDYFWFVDADDTVQPGAVARLTVVLKSSKPDLVLCDFRTLRDDFKIKHRLRGEMHKSSFAGPARQLIAQRDSLLRGLFARGQFHLWSKVARRELWEGLHFPHGRYYEDLRIAPALALRAQSFYYVPEVWIAYRQHGSSILAQRTPQKMADMMEALQWLPEALAQLEPPIDVPTRFTVAHYIARNYVAAARYLSQQADMAALKHCHETLQALLPMPASELLRSYLARGWLWRALRLKHWLALGARART